MVVETRPCVICNKAMYNALPVEIDPEFTNFQPDGGGEITLSFSYGSVMDEGKHSYVNSGVICDECGAELLKRTEQRPCPIERIYASQEEDVVKALNALYEADPVAVSYVVAPRVSANQKLQKIGVVTENKQFGVLGLLNSVLTKISLGMIYAVYKTVPDGSKFLTGFQKFPDPDEGELKVEPVPATEPVPVIAEQLMNYDNCHDGIVDKAADRLKKIHAAWNKYKENEQVGNYLNYRYFQDLDDLINGTTATVASVHPDEGKKE